MYAIRSYYGFRLVACESVVLDVMGYGALSDATALGLEGDPAADVGDGRALARCPDRNNFV